MSIRGYDISELVKVLGIRREIVLTEGKLPPETNGEAVLGKDNKIHIKIDFANIEGALDEPGIVYQSPEEIIAHELVHAKQYDEYKSREDYLDRNNFFTHLFDESVAYRLQRQFSQYITRNGIPFGSHNWPTGKAEDGTTH